MNALVAAELLKLRTTRTTWALLAGMLALVALGVSVGVARGIHPPVATDDELRRTFSAAGAGWLFVLALGVLATAGEFRHGTAARTFLAEPRRARVVFAKIAALGIAGLCFGLIATAATLALALPWLRARGVHVSVADAAVWRVVVGSIATTAVYGPIGVAVGALLRNQFAALIAVCAWGLGVEPALGALWPGAAPYFPDGAASAVTRAPLPHLLPTAWGALLFAGYAAAFAVAAVHTTIRRDPT